MKTIHTKQNKEKTKQKKSNALLTGSIVAILIAITPYIFYIFESFPNAAVWETSFFSYESKHFKNVSDLVWILTGKFVPWILLVLWFFTCRDWWYHVILIPIAMYSFQIFSVLNDDTKYYDEFEIYWLIPIMMIIIPIVYFIRLKLFDKYVYNIDLEKIDAELAEYERKEKELLEEQNE